VLVQIVRGAAGPGDQVPQEQEGWVICRVFKKKNLVHHGAAQSSGGGGTAAAASKMESSPTSTTIIGDHASDDALDHILQYMGGGDTKPALLNHHNQHLAAAADATTTTTAACPAAATSAGLYGNNKFMKLPPLEHAGGWLPPSPGPCEYGASGIADWDALDRLAAYELNGLSDASKNMAAFFDGDLWSMARSVSALHAADLAMNNA
jgi:hypothetical protein